MSFRALRVDDVAAVATPGEEPLEWHPLRAALGIGAFGMNAYVARAAGQLVVEPHAEDEHEELYVVLEGAATFVIDGETVEAPQGTLVHVTPESHREARALDAGTTVLVVGGTPGVPFAVSEWERRWLSPSRGAPTRG